MSVALAELGELDELVAGDVDATPRALAGGGEDIAGRPGGKAPPVVRLVELHGRSTRYLT